NVDRVVRFHWPDPHGRGLALVVLTRPRFSALLGGESVIDTSLKTRTSLLLRLRQAPPDQQAWAEFVDRYGRQIHVWCRRWGLQEADAQDVTQTVLLQLASKLQTFSYDPSQRFRGWLKTLTHHAWSDFLSAWKPAVKGTGHN